MQWELEKNKLLDHKKLQEITGTEQERIEIGRIKK